MELFKDKSEMNDGTKLEDNLACIEKLIRTAGGVCGNNPILVEKLLGGARTEKKHHPDHALCDGCDSERMTEKRICRCMYYFNSPEKKAVSNCDDCKLKYKRKNVGKIDAIEYEYPTE